MKLEIAVANKRYQKKWLNKRINWDDLVERLMQTQRTGETYKEFLAASKRLQADIKDVGGFVGGYLNNGVRDSRSIRHRQIVTLDIDECSLSIEDGLLSLIYTKMPYELLIYSTHKHCSEKPRLRIVIPLDRPVDPEEYEAISRYLAGEVGIDYFDPTTFQPERFMYWPSTSRDGEFLTEYEMGEICSADKILAEYVDWKDISAWPRLSTEIPEIVKESKKLGDPREKEGIVGAFCRVYDAEDVIENFLDSVYSKDDNGRYTFIEGTSAGGLILYSRNVFAYSHHSTDPARHQLLNAFDLVRIHKFGHLDLDKEKPMAKRESFIAMCAFAVKDSSVKAELDSVDRPLSKAIYTEFEDELIDDDWMCMGSELDDPDALLNSDMEILNVGNVSDYPMPDVKLALPGGINEDNWKDHLDRTSKGEITAKISNFKLMLIFDPDLKGKIAYNEFEQSLYIRGAMPWDSRKEVRRWGDADEAGIREIIETKYKLYHVSKVIDALILAAHFNKFHPVKSYLESLPKWDGVERLDTMFVEYLGAEDTPFVRAATRKSFVAAVARVYKPGCKFDYVTTLVGPEGLKKSALFAEMAGRWFSDSFTTVEGKTAYEQLQGSWITEIAELSAFNKSETNAIKAFVTKRFDKYRPAYGKTIQDAPRQGVFFATTNEFTFLKGNTGNRRFWPIKVSKRYARPSFAEMSGNGAEIVVGMPVKQLWAEAIYRFQQGEKLYLSDELEAEAKRQQEIFSESDERIGLIERYLSVKLPHDWDEKGRMERRDYMAEASSRKDGVVHRQYVCISEIWEECLGLNPKDMNNYKVKELSELIARLPNWVRKDSKRSFSIYGQQRYFQRTDPVNV